MSTTSCSLATRSSSTPYRIKCQHAPHPHKPPSPRRPPHGPAPPLPHHPPSPETRPFQRLVTHEAFRLHCKMQGKRREPPAKVHFLLFSPAPRPPTLLKTLKSLKKPVVSQKLELPPLSSSSAFLPKSNALVNVSGVKCWSFQWLLKPLCCAAVGVLSACHRAGPGQSLGWPILFTTPFKDLVNQLIFFN